MEMVCIKKEKYWKRPTSGHSLQKHKCCFIFAFWFIQDSAGPFVQAYNTDHTTYLQGRRLLFLSHSFAKELRFLSRLGNINGGSLFFA